MNPPMHATMLSAGPPINPARTAKSSPMRRQSKDSLMDVDQERVRRSRVRCRLEGRPLARRRDAGEQALGLGLHFIERPPAPLDALQLLRIVGSMDLKLSRREKLRPHAKKSNQVRRVLHVVLIAPHH